MLSLILPTFNEAANVRALLSTLQKVLVGIDHEIIVVDDDSPDGTWKAAEEIAMHYPQVRVLRRVGRRGLSSAVTEGFGMAKGDTLMVMDSDGQHDASLVPRLHAAIWEGADVVVASRYTQGGSTGGWGGPRLWLSHLATSLARALPPVRTSDPMSGFFAVKASSYRSVEKLLHPRGFKILLEILRYLPVSSKLSEVPMTFGLRTAGESKMSFGVQMTFLGQLAGIAVQRFAHAWGFFWVLCSVLLCLLILQIWPIRYLYLSSQTRTQVQSVLRQVSDEQGWLLSDMDIREVRPGHLRIVYRSHIRGMDPTQCIRFALPSAAPLPCIE